MASFQSIKFPRGSRTPSENLIWPSHPLTYLFPLKTVFASQPRTLTFMQNIARPSPADAILQYRRSAITNAECPIRSPFLSADAISRYRISAVASAKSPPNDAPPFPPTRSRYRIGVSSPESIQYLTTSRYTRDPQLTSSAVQPMPCLRQQPEKPKKLRAGRKVAFRSSRSRNRGSFRCNGK